MCSADAFAMNPQDAFPGGIPLPNFATPNFIESRFVEMDTLLQQTRSLFSHLEMRISHIEGRLQAVESLFHSEPEEAQGQQPRGNVISFTRVHPYRVALVGSVFISALVVATVLHSRDGERGRFHAHSLVAQAAVSTAPVRTPISVRAVVASAAPIHETKTASLPIVSHESASQVDSPSLKNSRLAALEMPMRSVEVADEKVHTVVSGDSLTSIARDHGVPIAQLLALNPMQNPNLLAVGQKIRVPLKGEMTEPERVEPVAAAYVVPRTGKSKSMKRVHSGRKPVHVTAKWTRQAYKLVHAVQPGDTFYHLSIRYGVPLQALIKTNPGLNPRRLLIAQEMKIPTGFKKVSGTTVKPVAQPALHTNHAQLSRKPTPVAALPSIPGPTTVPMPSASLTHSPENSEGFITEVSR